MQGLSFEPLAPKGQESRAPATPQIKDDPAQPFRIPDAPARAAAPPARLSQDASAASPPPMTSDIPLQPNAHAAKPPTSAGGMRALLARSQAAQLVTAGVVSAVLLTGYIWFTQRREMFTDLSAAAPQGFPKLVVETQNARATEADVQARLQAPRLAQGPTDGPAAPRWRMQPAAKPGKVAPAQRSRHQAASRKAIRAIMPPPTPADAQTRSFPAEFYGGGVIKASAPAATAKPVALPLGQRLAVSLREGLSSSYTGVVLAQVTQAIESDGHTVLNVGDVLKGRAQNDGERIFIEFFEAVTDHATFKFTGYATDGTYPGLVADRRETDGSEKGRQSAMDGILQAAKSATAGAAAAVSGSLPGQVVVGAAQGVANQTFTDMQQDTRTRARRVLQLPRGKVFHVVITGA